jgi:mannose-1-phosphate guanylyltransferase
VIWDSVHVENGASVKNSVVMSDCIVDKNSEKISCVLTENKSYPIAV